MNQRLGKLFLNNYANFQDCFRNIMADQILAVIVNEGSGQLRSGLHFLSSYCFLLSCWLICILSYILLISKVS